MEEYGTLGNTTKLDDSKIAPNIITCYLLHHGVIKLSSSTTKVRVVFNASANISTGIYFNDISYVGPYST